MAFHRADDMSDLLSYTLFAQDDGCNALPELHQLHSGAVPDQFAAWKPSAEAFSAPGCGDAFLLGGLGNDTHVGFDATSAAVVAAPIVPSLVDSPPPAVVPEVFEDLLSKMQSPTRTAPTPRRPGLKMLPTSVAAHASIRPPSNDGNNGVPAATVAPSTSSGGYPAVPNRASHTPMTTATPHRSCTPTYYAAGGGEVHASFAPAPSEEETPTVSSRRPTRARVAPKKYGVFSRELVSDSDDEDDESYLPGRSPNCTDDDEDQPPAHNSTAAGTMKRQRRAPSTAAGAESDEDESGDDEVGAISSAMASDDEVLSGMLDPKEEKFLRHQLKRHLKDLNTCTAQSKGMSPFEKKKLRNRKASRVSRLRKKLSVFDLQRKYQDALSDIDEYRAALKVMEVKVQHHEPQFRCALVQHGTARKKFRSST